jgi:hypothetical protein
MIRLHPPILLAVVIAGIVLAIFGGTILALYSGLFVSIGAAVIGYARWDERHRS